MNEPLSAVMRFRTTPSHRARILEAAALAGIDPSVYIRRRLSADDALQEELTLLRQIVAEQAQARAAHAAVIELLHLARAIARPEHIASAQAAVRRLGLMDLTNENHPYSVRPGV